MKSEGREACARGRPRRVCWPSLSSRVLSLRAWTVHPGQSLASCWAAISFIFSGWSDNLFSFAPTVDKEAYIMAAVEKVLWNEHRLLVAPDSREMITANRVTFESYVFQDPFGSR
ncbi:unnamed protein product [Prorocentrum cordatum]|uniref:Uncharacterized protein n=1 Tax=Prorocentrum cordatum TaxID=2364126 RepID=A0ABN9QMB7_9DINO|nr:unnamed protein product [Polarella glacialis]